jgi:hypothetical protein
VKVYPKRRFAFVGYRTSEDALSAQSWWNGTWFAGGRLKVEVVDEVSHPYYTHRVGTIMLHRRQMSQLLKEELRPLSREHARFLSTHVYAIRLVHKLTPHSLFFFPF